MTDPTPETEFNPLPLIEPGEPPHEYTEAAMSEQQLFEPGEIPPTEEDPPGKMEFIEVADGWLQHIAFEMQFLVHRMTHVYETITKATEQLALYTSEEKRTAAVQRAESRLDAMIQNPLPAFPNPDTEESSE